jgi:Mg-chelatase subunit ChlD
MSYSRLTLAFAMMLGCSTSEDGGFTSGANDASAGTGSIVSRGSVGIAGDSSPPANTDTGVAGTLSVTQNGGASGDSQTFVVGGGTASSTAEGPIPPTKLILVYDTSGSMGDDPSTNRMNAASRWEPVKSAVFSLLRNPRMATVEVALIFFPEGGDKEKACGHDYGVPVVPMRESSSSLITQAISSRETTGGTPTLPALWGAYNYARQLMASNPASRVRVLLLTDGEPAIYNAATKQTEIDCAPVGCSLTNTIFDIVTLAASNFGTEQSIVTHVAGIGEARSSMKAIADAGGGGFVEIDGSDDYVGKNAAALLKLIAQ